MRKYVELCIESHVEKRDVWEYIRMCNVEVALLHSGPCIIRRQTAFNRLKIHF